MARKTTYNITDTVATYIQKINQKQTYLGNLDSINLTPFGSINFSNRVNQAQNFFYDSTHFPGDSDAVNAVNYLWQKVGYFQGLLFMANPPNITMANISVDSAVFKSLSGGHLGVPIKGGTPSAHIQGRAVPGYLFPGDSAPADSDYHRQGLLAIDSAEITYLNGNYLRLGPDYFDSPYMGYYALLQPGTWTDSNESMPPYLDSNEVIDFGLTADVVRIEKLMGGHVGFPFPAPRRYENDSGYLQDSSTIFFDSADFTRLYVGNFFIADSTPTQDSSDWQQFRFPHDSANFKKFEFNNMHFDSNDTFNQPMRYVQRLSIETDSEVFNVGGFLLSPFDSATRIT